MDTFDPKPKLTRAAQDRIEADRQGRRRASSSSSAARSSSARSGKSGIEMCDQWKHLADPDVADELCNYRGCQAESLNHPEALFHMNTGSRLGGDPGARRVGDLRPRHGEPEPARLRRDDRTRATRRAAPGNWSNGFLPAYYQGTRLRPEGSPILDLSSQPFKSREHQRRFLDELAFLNEQHAAAASRAPRSRRAHGELRTGLPHADGSARSSIDLKSETKATREMYGLDDKETATFGRQCLLARRLVEKGVRFVQIFSGGWDSHDYLERGHTARIQSVDKPMAALIKISSSAACSTTRSSSGPANSAARRTTTSAAASIRSVAATTPRP